MDGLEDFDPNTDDEETLKELRERYHNLIDSLNNKTQDCGDAGVPTEFLREIMRDADDLFIRVKHCPEARLDAQLLKAITSLGKANIEKTQSNFLTFRPSEFAENVLQHVKSALGNEREYNDSEEEDIEDETDFIGEKFWTRLGTEVTGCFNSTVGLKPLYGALDTEPPKRIRKERQTQRSEPKELRILSQKTGPTVLDPNADNAQGEEVNRVNKYLKKVFHHRDRKPIPYFEFVLDPTSFATTVENMFHLSFLIRDGHAEISLDKSSMPVISPIRRDAEREARGNSSNSRQAIFDMSLDLWEEFIKVLKITQPMIPPRHQTQ